MLLIIKGLVRKNKPTKTKLSPDGYLNNTIQVVPLVYNCVPARPSFTKVDQLNL